MNKLATENRYPFLQKSPSQMLNGAPSKKNR